MDNQQLLRDIKARLTVVYGARLRGVILYGSEARGEGRPDSDIDVLALLDGPVVTWQAVKAASEAVYPLILNTGRTIDVMPVNIRDYEKGDAPLYLSAARDGVRL